MAKVVRYKKGRKRVCFCEKKPFDWRDARELSKYLTSTGKIRARSYTNNCATCQRRLARAVKRAREMGILPYVIRPTLKVRK